MRGDGRRMWGTCETSPEVLHRLWELKGARRFFTGAQKFFTGAWELMGPRRFFTGARRFFTGAREL